jgi:hypothetical protein
VAVEVLLAVPAHPQAGPPERDHPHGPPGSSLGPGSDQLMGTAKSQSGGLTSVADALARKVTRTPSSLGCALCSSAQA